MRPCAVLIILVTLVVPAVAESPSGPNSRLVYLNQALDEWSINLSIAIAMTKDPHVVARARAVETLASNPRHDRIRLLGMYAGDNDPRVRQRAMLAAGRLGPAGLKIALGGLSDNSSLVRQAAAWAACHGGPEALERLTRLLETERDRAVLETLLANLWRLEGAPWLPLVLPNASSRDVFLRRAVAYSLSRTGDEAARPAQRLLAGDSEAVIRATVLGAFARGNLFQEDRKVVFDAVADEDWRVRSAAMRVLAAHDEMEVPPAAAARVVEALSSERTHLAVSAIAAAGAQPEIGSPADLAKIVAGKSPWRAAAALQALAKRQPAAATEIAEEWFSSGELWKGRAAATSAVDLGAEIEEKAATAAPASIRLAWLESLDGAQTGERTARLTKMLTGDPDSAVRAQILSLLRAAGAAPDTERLLELHTAWQHDEMPDARVDALVAAMASVEEAEERAAILKIGLADPDTAAVAMAVNGARRLGMEVDLPPREPRHGAKWYADLVEWTTTRRWLDVVTTRGSFRIRLDLVSAPLTAREISDLAEDGFYDGLDFHRVVPNFVVQGGDPRGDGWGGPGFALPDEPSMLPFDSWRVGIATSGPQTGGCQLFVTLMPADHLTGHYTNLGEVISGREVLTSLEVGDTIVTIRPVAGPDPPLPNATNEAGDEG